MIRTKVKGKGIGNRDVVKAPNFYIMPSSESDSESTTAMADDAPSSPVSQAHNKLMTPSNQGQEELDHYLQGVRRPIRPRRVSIINLDPHYAPSIPRLSYEKPINNWQTVAHHVPAFRAPNIHAFRETDEVGSELNSIFEPISWYTASTHTFRPIQEDEEEEQFKAFIGRTIQLL